MVRGSEACKRRVVMSFADGRTRMSNPTRRTMLAQTACLLSSVTAVSAQPRKPKVVIAGGHPGDPEYGCGGVAARCSARGDEVVLLYLNRGQGGISGKTPAEAGEIRTAEARNACQILHARPVFANQIDGQSIVDRAHYEEFRKILEAEKPDVLFTQWPIDGHPDHRATSMLCLDGWLRMGKSFALFYYEVSNGEDTLMFSPTHYVDITAVEAQKRASCYAHASQQPDHFYALQSEVAHFRGVENGTKYAEAFIQQIQSPDDMLPR